MKKYVKGMLALLLILCMALGNTSLTAVAAAAESGTNGNICKIEVMKIEPYMNNLFDTSEEYKCYDGSIDFILTYDDGKTDTIKSHNFSSATWKKNSWYVGLRWVNDTYLDNIRDHVAGAYPAVLEAYRYVNGEKKVYATSAPFDFTVASMEENLKKAGKNYRDLSYNTKTSVSVKMKEVDDGTGGLKTVYQSTYLKFVAQYDGYHVLQNTDKIKRSGDKGTNWYANIYVDGQYKYMEWDEDETYVVAKLKKGQTCFIELHAYDENGIKSYNFMLGYFGDTKKPVEETRRIPVTAVTLNQSALAVNIGSKTLLSAALAPTNATDKSVTWTSSNTDVAAVSQSGMVYGTGKGTAVITATAHNGVKASCTVTVYPVYANGILINKTTAEVKKGKTLNLIAMARPVGVTNGVLQWTSNKPEVASVDENGNVTGIKGGTAFIIAAATDGSGQKATCKVTVVVPTTKVTVAKKTVYLAKGKSTMISTIVTPLDSTDKVIFATSNNKIAAVNAKGKVTGKAKGTAIITVKAGKKSVKVKVKVDSAKKVTKLKFTKKSITVKTGKVQFLDWRVTPSTANAALTWKTSNKKVVEVSNGKITAKKAGIAKITVSSGKVKATITVQVK